MSKFKDQKDKKYKRTTPFADKLNKWTRENVSDPLRGKYPDLANDAESVSSFFGSMVDPEDNVIAGEVPSPGSLVKSLVGKGLKKLSKEELMKLSALKTTDKARASRRYKDIPQPSTKETPTISWTKDVNKKFKEDPLAKMRREKEHNKIASSGRKDVKTKPASGKVTHKKKKGDPVTEIEFDLLDE